MMITLCTCIVISNAASVEIRLRPPLLATEPGDLAPLDTQGELGLGPIETLTRTDWDQCHPRIGTVIRRLLVAKCYSGGISLLSALLIKLSLQMAFGDGGVSIRYTSGSDMNVVELDPSLHLGDAICLARAGR